MSATDFGTLLKTLREQHGVSQSKLAERADFDHSYVSRLESGARMPTREAVDRLGRAMSLEQAQQDSMLASAGFLPRDVSSLLSNEPALGEMLEMLQDESVPSEFRENVRNMLRIIVQQAQYAVSSPSLSANGGVAA